MNKAPHLEQLEWLLNKRSQMASVLTFHDGKSVWVYGLGVGRDLGVAVPHCTADESYLVPTPGEEETPVKRFLFFHLDEVVRVTDPLSEHVLYQAPTANDGSGTE